MWSGLKSFSERLDAIGFTDREWRKVSGAL